MQFITILVSSSLLLSLLLNYSFNQLFLKRNKIDKVKPRSSHNVIATKSGGVAIFSSLGIITIFLYATSNEILIFHYFYHSESFFLLAFMMIFMTQILS